MELSCGCVWPTRMRKGDTTTKQQHHHTNTYYIVVDSCCVRTDKPTVSWRLHNKLKGLIVDSPEPERRHCVEKKHADAICR